MTVSGQILPQATCRICGVHAVENGDAFKLCNMTSRDPFDEEVDLCGACAKELLEWVGARRDERLARTGRQERHCDECGTDLSSATHHILPSNRTRCCDCYWKHLEGRQ